MQANIGGDTAATVPKPNNQPHDDKRKRNTIRRSNYVPATMQRFDYKTWIMTLKVIYLLLWEKVVAPEESAGGGHLPLSFKLHSSLLFNFHRSVIQAIM